MLRKALAVALVTGVLAPALAASAAAGEHSYVGTRKCKRCHIKQWRSWSESAMATTFEKLKPGVAVEAKKSAGLDPDVDYTTLERCVKCHVTGYGEEGGFVDFETTPDLVGVGCESCHGAGGTYTQDQYMSLRNKEFVKAEIVAVGLVDPIGEAQCIPCHNASSPFVEDGEVFDYEDAKDRDTHEHFELKYKH